MGKLAGLVTAVALLAVVAAPAGAGMYGFGLTGGAAIPTGDFSDGFDAGFGLGGYGEYWFNDQGAFGIDVGYNRHNAKDEFNDALNTLTEFLLLAGGATTASSDLEVTGSSFMVGVHGKWAPPASETVAPYFQGGLGMYSGRIAIEGPVSADGMTINLDEDDTETDLGINFGAGLLFKAGPTTSIGLAAAFHNVFSDESSTQFFTVGAQVHFMTGAR